jgi:hypothetical protein
MARIVADFAQEKPVRGRHPTYPWKEWTDGKARLLVRGEDYKAQDEGMRSYVHTYARRNNLVVRTHLDAEGLLVQFILPVPKVAKKGIRKLKRKA